MRLLRSKATGNLVVLALLGLWFLTLATVAMKGPAAYIEVVGHSMDGTYRTGDLVITRQQDSYAKGDIVAFRVGRDEGGGQVIHRIIGGNGTKGYRMQGDNNPDPDPWRPTDGDVIGKAWIHLEQKAWLLHLPRNPTAAGLAAGLITLIVLGLDARPRRGDRPEPAAQPDHREPVAETVGTTLSVVPSQRTADHDSPLHQTQEP